jgi:hypothetical protein
MQTVSICDENFSVHFPCCGKQSVSVTGEVQPCKHLVSVTSNEADEPWFVGAGVTPAENDEEDVVQSLRKRFRGRGFLMYVLSQRSRCMFDRWVCVDRPSSHHTASACTVGTSRRVETCGTVHRFRLSRSCLYRQARS